MKDPIFFPWQLGIQTAEVPFGLLADWDIATEGMVYAWREVVHAREPGPSGFKKVSLDPDQIKAWSKEWPNAMIVIPTGSRIGRFPVYDVAELAAWATEPHGPQSGLGLGSACGHHRMKPSKTRSPRIDGNRAKAGRKTQLELLNIDPCRLLQARRVKTHVRCPEVAAIELARLVYKEACE